VTVLVPGAVPELDLLAQVGDFASRVQLKEMVALVRGLELRDHAIAVPKDEMARAVFARGFLDVAIGA
jgi:hypothetical protein